MTTLVNVGVFINGRREFVGGDVTVTDTHIIVGPAKRRDPSPVPRPPRATYPIVEVVSDEAWDVTTPGGRLVRLVATTDCGCGGRLQYRIDASYSGTLDSKGRPRRPVDR